MFTLEGALYLCVRIDGCAVCPPLPFFFLRKVSRACFARFEASTRTCRCQIAFCIFTRVSVCTCVCFGVFLFLLVLLLLYDPPPHLHHHRFFECFQTGLFLFVLSLMFTFFCIFFRSGSLFFFLCCFLQLFSRHCLHTPWPYKTP